MYVCVAVSLLFAVGYFIWLLWWWRSIDGCYNGVLETDVEAEHWTLDTGHWTLENWIEEEGRSGSGQLMVALKAIRPQHRKTRLRLWMSTVSWKYSIRCWIDWSLIADWLLAGERTESSLVRRPFRRWKRWYCWCCCCSVSYSWSSSTTASPECLPPGP